MIGNGDNENKSNLKRVITEQTRPETNPYNGGNNNLNSIINNNDMFHMLKVPKSDRGNIENNIIKEIDSNDNTDKLCINTNVKNNSNTNVNIHFAHKRFDHFGTLITKGGKQKITFIDKITKNTLTDVVKIESYKEYNKMEETANEKRNNCCILI